MTACRANYTTRILFFFLIGAVAVLPLIIISAQTVTASSVSARYTQSSGSQIVVEINAGSPPPKSVILIQRFPSHIRMLNAQPGASNYNEKKNSAKWLLRNLRSGSTTVKVTLDGEVQAREVSAEIRYMSQQGGKMTTIQVIK